MCIISVGVKVQLGVECEEVCPALAYSLSSVSAWSRADATSLFASKAATLRVLP